MNQILFGIAIVAASLTACNNNEQSTPNNTSSSDSNQTNSSLNATTEKQPAAVDDVVDAYLQLKNALVSDNGNEAATAGKQLTLQIQEFDKVPLTDEQTKIYQDVKEDMLEHAEHINANAGNIEHQREHFEILSKDMYDLVKIHKPGHTLYQTHCPMYNDGKGATWLSEVKEIKNPYYGSKMLRCGTVNEEIK